MITELYKAFQFKVNKKLYFTYCLLIGFAAADTIVANPPGIKIYAYSQETMPGMIPVDEEGNPRKREPNIAYMIYAVYPAGYQLKFDGIWIKGKGYTVQVSSVEKTPVVVTNHDIPSKPVSTTLVPATNQKVIALQPIAESASRVNATWFRDMLKKNELVVSYFYKGKKYFIPVRKIKVLPPVAAM